jgi:topoisomerase-4 subunit A
VHNHKVFLSSGAKLEEMKIQGEQKELAEEKEKLELLLSSEARLKTYIKNELKAVVKTFGDARRSSIKPSSQQSQAFNEDDLMPAENITVVLSDNGWVRSAKGHDIVFFCKFFLFALDFHLF